MKISCVPEKSNRLFFEGLFAANSSLRSNKSQRFRSGDFFVGVILRIRWTGSVLNIVYSNLDNFIFQGQFR